MKKSAIRKVDNMSSTKLKNCPCCGGLAIITEATLLFTSPGDVKARIMCTNCGLTLEDDYDTAKEKWNARVENVSELKSENDSRVREEDLCTHY